MKLISLGTIAVLTYYGFVETGPHTHGRIGILWNPVDHSVVEVYRGSPAAVAGIKRHDIVKHVNDVDIAGAAYTKVNLTIKRKEEILFFEVERIPDKLIDVRHPLPHEH